MKSSVIAFPRIGEKRELKFASEKYFAGEITEEELLSTAADLRLAHWKLMKKEGIEWIPSGDFSLYDNMLDTAVLLHAVPEEYRKLGLHATAAYFAMARGYQGEKGDVKALAMKKWFNTNYHYIVPELDDTTEIAVTGNKLFHEFTEAKEAGIETKPTMIGPFTFLKLAYFRGKKSAADFVPQITAAYGSVLSRLGQLGADWAAFEEPALVKDLCREDVELFQTLYKEILKEKGNVKVLLQTYFGDIRDCYREAVKLPFDGLGLDFVEGEKTEELLAQYGFPQDKVLFAGVVNGKNIWKCSYEKTCLLIEKIRNYGSETVLQPSCSLLLVPYTLAYEKKLPEDVKQYFSFALEKLAELSDLKQLAENASWRTDPVFLANREIFYKPRTGEDREVREAIKKLTDSDFRREMLRCEREKLQKEKLGLPLFPTTTIGSFPQTKLVKANRSAFRRGEKTKEQYDEQIRELMKDCIKRQEETGLDVLVHGEFERNDMVEYFGENLKGYVFTEFGWVQSYGTRCLKPPIIFGDIKREHPITVAYIKYAQSLTKKPVKGMLTGPVTILNWSFPREDISLKEMAYQIGLAIRGEVTDLEKAGISVIQIDEAALREKMPLRKEEWFGGYLDWAIPAFRLCHAAAAPQTQIHTHMCYSEFSDIIRAIDDMDADVITFEASRSGLHILTALQENHFETEVGPGVYDIHSPRVPSVEEIVEALQTMLTKLDKDKLWVNPDCGLKTRGERETWESLRNLVEAAQLLRESYGYKKTSKCGILDKQ